MSTTIACKAGQSTAFLNIPISVASVAGEATVIVQVTTGTPVDLMMVGTKDWTYRATTGVSTNDLPVSAGQVLTLRFYITTTFFILRQSVDGSVTLTPIALSKSVP